MSDIYGFGKALHFVFGGDVPDEPLELHQVAARAVIVYVLGVAVVRIGKERSIGRMTSLDVIVGFVLGSLLSRGITGNASLSGTAAASVALMAMHWLLTRLACDWHWFGNLVKGRAHLIVKDGQMLPDAMRQHHISIHDLQEALRLEGFDDLGQVREAYKERNGEVSVLPRK